MAELNLQDGIQPDGSLSVTVYPKRREAMSAEEEMSSFGGSDVISSEPVAGTSVSSPQPIKAVENNFAKIQEALNQGYSRQEIAKYLQQNLGIDPDEADKQVIESVQNKIKEAQAQGYTPDEIKNYLIQNRYDGSIIDSALKTIEVPRSWKKYEWDPNTTAEEAQDISDLYKNVYGKYSTMGKQVLGFVSEQSGIEARREINQLNISIAEKLKEEGIDAFINPSSGDLMMRDENGIEQEVDSSFVNDIYNSKAEVTGAIAGGIYGAKLGTKVPGKVKILAVPAMSIAGSMFGSSIGKAADMTINAAILKEDLEANLYMQQMKEAAIFDGVMNVVGTSLFKSGKYGYKAIMRAYDFALAGNSKGAYKALLENMQISDDQAKALVEQWEKFNQVKAPGKTYEDKAIAVISSTQQGAEGVIKYSAARNQRLANVVISDIDQRAKGLIASVDNVADENVGKFVREDLGKYRQDVKDFYGLIKNQGADAINGTDFRFNFEKLAIDPVLENIGKNITDPKLQENFVVHMSRIQGASKDRTFGGLLELRTTVNDFKYSKTGMSKADKEALDSVLNRIDGQIGRAVKEYMPQDGAAWVKNFSKAKEEYAKMKVLEQNAIYRFVTKKTRSEASIQQALSRFGGNKDVDMELYEPIITRLSGATRAKVEGAAIKNLVNKYTLGETADKQAIHFPALYDAMKGLNLQTQEGKNLLRVTEEISKIFKNDVSLSKISGNIAVPKFQSYLTDNPVERVRFEISSSVFNVFKRMLPGELNRNLALLNKVDKLLRDPLHARTAEDLIKSMPKGQQAEMQSLIKQLQIETAKAPKKAASTTGYMYKQTTTGKATVTSGTLGKGVYLVDKVTNPVEGSKVIKQEVQFNKLATMQDISNLLGREVTEKELRTMPELQQKLIDKGYLGIRVEGRAMLFPETTVGVKAPKKSFAKQAMDAMADVAKRIDNVSNAMDAIDNPTVPLDKKGAYVEAIARGEDTSKVLNTQEKYKTITTKEGLHIDVDSLSDVDKGVLKFRGRVGFTLDVNNKAFSNNKLDYLFEEYNRYNNDAMDYIGNSLLDSVPLKEFNRRLEKLTIKTDKEKYLKRADNDASSSGEDFVSAYEIESVSSKDEFIEFGSTPTRWYKVPAGSSYIPKNEFFDEGEVVVKRGDLIPITEEEAITGLTLSKSKILNAPDTSKVKLYRGVDGDYPDKEFTFWTDNKDAASDYARGAALTNKGKNPKILEREFSGGKGRNIQDEIDQAVMEGFEYKGKIIDDPDEIAKLIMKDENLDWAEFTHPGTRNSDDHLVRVVRNKKGKK
jgi:outer membrane lipoprotein SlyB